MTAGASDYGPGSRVSMPRTEYPVVVVGKRTLPAWLSASLLLDVTVDPLALRTEQLPISRKGDHILALYLR